MTYSRERLPADNSENESWIMQNTSIESHQSGGLAASRDQRISTLKKKNKSSEEKQKERNNNLVNRMSRNQ